MNTDNDSNELYRWHEVRVCTGDLLFTGMLRCGITQRLIDAINEGVPAGTSALSLHFLPLSNVEEKSSGSGIQKYHELHIAKSNILFVGRGVHEIKETTLNSYPYRQKVSMPVKILATPYTILGNIHIDTWGQLPDTIESGAMFFPITSAQVTPAPPGGHDHFDFMAINRTRIIYLHEET